MTTNDASCSARTARASADKRLAESRSYQDGLCTSGSTARAASRAWAANASRFCRDIPAISDAREAASPGTTKTSDLPNSRQRRYSFWQ